MASTQSIQFSQDSSQFDASTGVKADLAGLTASLLGNSTDYTWVEPKSGIISTVFPSESTWHPLYDHDYREIANDLFSISASKSLSDSQKQLLSQRVKDITIESYPRAAMGWFYKILIVCIIVLIIILYFGGSLSDYKGTLIGLGVGIGIILAVIYIYAEYWARGSGEAYWQEFNSDLTGKLRSGIMPNVILESYGARVDRERDRVALASVRRASSGNIGSSSALGGFMGSMLGNLISGRR